VDVHLKALAAISLGLTTAEEALAEDAAQVARERAEAAAAGLAELRARWPALSAAERSVVGPTAAPLRARLDALEARLPRRRALSETEPQPDPEEEIDPAA